jgi:hypothetical protein
MINDNGKDVGSNVVPIKKRGRFGKPGIPNPGKPKGAIAKNTRLLKEAIMLAAEIEGQDGNGKGKLVGFMRKVAQEDLRAFCMLLSRIIPLQVETKEMEPEKKRTTYKSVEEVKRELASRGVSMDIMFKIMTAEPQPLRDRDDMMNDDDDGEVIDAEPVNPDA